MTTQTTEFYGDNELRWYQIAAREAMIQAFNERLKRIMVVLPTGAGKTITVACSLGDSRMKDALNVPADRAMRVLFVSHVRSLLSQAERVFAEENNVELIPQSMFSPVPADVMEAGWDVCVFDEGHHECCLTFQTQLESVGDRPIVFITATPDRPDGMLIKCDRIINPISREQAVMEGYLAETTINSFVDYSGTDKAPTIKRLLDRYLPQFGRTIVFVRTIAEVTNLTEYLKSKKVNVVGVTNQTAKELENVLQQFSNGEIQFIVNCDRLGEGIDVKGCTDVLIGKHYGSYTQLNQVIGRAARPDSECNVWELINPLNPRNLESTVVVGTPKDHRLISHERGDWVERNITYSI